MTPRKMVSMRYISLEQGLKSTHFETHIKGINPVTSHMLKCHTFLFWLLLWFVMTFAQDLLASLEVVNEFIWMHG